MYIKKCCEAEREVVEKILGIKLHVQTILAKKSLISENKRPQKAGLDTG